MKSAKLSDRLPNEFLQTPELKLKTLTCQRLLQATSFIFLSVIFTILGSLVAGQTPKPKVASSYPSTSGTGIATDFLIEGFQRTAVASPGGYSASSSYR
ncbi:hypothetical protein HanPSC8_Chr01g0040581 [Helianthus annuus]|nr:hypothetical protein HanPSC8_Chr01g0040581 [Helianthus annuus]